MFIELSCFLIPVLVRQGVCEDEFEHDFEYIPDLDPDLNPDTIPDFARMDRESWLGWIIPMLGWCIDTDPRLYALVVRPLVKDSDVMVRMGIAVGYEMELLDVIREYMGQEMRENVRII